jgi:Tol biopolymer transport system component
MHSYRSLLRQTGVFVVLSTAAAAGTTTRVSVRSSGAEADKASSSASMSADGRYVAFASDAKDLVLGDTNDLPDVFVHDMQTGSTIRVSIGSAGEQGDGDSGAPRISADGRYVVFQSTATNLVPSDGNAASDVFVRDLQANTITRVSVDSSGAEANGGSFAPAISSDGRFVAFQSDATNLVEGDTNAATDVFVRDLVAGTTVRVSVSSSAGEGDGPSTTPSISGDGRFVAFQSLATDLVPGDTNQASDVFVYDRQQARIHQVSLNSLGLEGDAASVEPSISADGRWAAFVSSATNLVHGDLNGHDDVFVRDLQAGETTRASLSSSGAEGDGDSAWPAISADGRFVAFESLAANLVPEDGNDAKDVFLRDRWTAATSRVSVDSSGTEANGDSYGAAIPADAREIAFTSAASNLVAGDSNDCTDVFLNDRGPDSAFVAFCFGDGSAARCPCGNLGAAGHGCENSSTTGPRSWPRPARRASPPTPCSSPRRARSRRR